MWRDSDPGAQGCSRSQEVSLCGEVREWLNRAVSKTVVPLRVPWVRIPPSPSEKKNKGTRSRGDKENLLSFSPSSCPLVSLSVFLERSPNWYGTALEARRVERPVRVRVPLSPLTMSKAGKRALRARFSALLLSYQAPASVQS